jgi:hypothetical protein
MASSRRYWCGLRWAFIALAAGGLATVGAIIKIRKYVDRLPEPSEQENH